MDSERLWVLMNQQLDGENSRAEEQDLREELERSVEARHLMGELRELSRELASVKQVELSADLTSSVMSSVRASRRRSQEGAQIPSAGLRTRVGISPLWLYPLAAGLLMGLLLGVLWMGTSPQSLQIENLYGTIGSGLEWVAVAQEDLGAELVKVGRSGAGVLIEIQVGSEEPVELEFHFDQARLGLKGLSCPSPCRVLTAAGTLSVHPSGAGRHDLLFELAGEAPVSLELHLRRSGLLSHRSSWVFESDGSFR